MISILILTLNEEANLPACLASVAWSDDVVVLDSFSSDRTCDIARSAGARVIQRRFDNWASHQNWAVRNIPFRHPWVYYSDADETVPPDLAEEMQKVTADPNRHEVAYRLRFKNLFGNRWLKRSSLYPTWVLRLFRPVHVRWERLVNPIPVVEGPVGHLHGQFNHHLFSRGLDHWKEKHAKYAEQEAVQNLRELSEGAMDWAGLFSIGDPARRRRALKLLSFRLPFRPALRFFYGYCFRFGFLDGRPGLKYCRLMAWYEKLIDDNLRRLRSTPVDMGPPSFSRG